MANRSSKIKTLYFVANARMPTEKAHGLQIAKMCESYARCGVNVTLLVPRKNNPIAIDPYEYYGVERNFKIQYVSILPILKRFPKLSFFVTELSFNTRLFFFFLLKRKTIIISRDILVPFFLGTRQNIFYELHDYPLRHRWIWRRGLTQAKGIIITNAWKAKKLTKDFALPLDKILVAPNGFDEQIFHPRSQPIGREELEIPADAHIVCYAGMLKTMGVEKGVDQLFEAVSLLPAHVVLLLVGGTQSHIGEYTAKAGQQGITDRVRFVPRVPYNEVARYLALGDVLVAPFPDTEHYRFFMSPIKLFEYLAMAKPLVVSKLESIEEIAGDAALYAEPGNAKMLADMIKTIMNEPHTAALLAREAVRISEQYTWRKRAENIQSFINNLST